MPRNDAEAFKMCRDYQESKGYTGLTQGEVEFILGDRPCRNFIMACGPNVTSTRAGGDMIYSFRYRR